MAIRDIKKIPTYENNINTQVAQGQIQRTQQAQENPEYNNWGALGPIANGIASIGKSISSVFEQQDITRQNDNVAKMQKAYQLEIESKTADPREMKEIIADLDKWYIDYAEGLDLSEKDRKTLDTAALKYQTIRTQDWGARKAIANRELQGEQIQALLKEAEARNASVEEITQIVYGQNTAGRYPGNLADIADEYFDKKMLEAVHTDFEKKKLGEATVTGVGLQELKSTEVDTEALRQESYNYAKSLEIQWNIEHKRDSIYSDLEADLLIRESVSRKNYQTIYQDYLTIPINEAVDRLNGEVVLDEEWNPIPLTTVQKEEMKKTLIDSDHHERTVASLEYGNSISKLMEDRANGLTYEKFKETYESYPGVTDPRSAWEWVTGEYGRKNTAAQDEAYDKLQKTLAINTDAQGYTTNRTAGLKLIISEMDNLSGADFKAAIKSQQLPGSLDVDPEENLSKSIVKEVEIALMAGEIDTTEAAVIITNASKDRDIRPEEFSSHQTFLKNFAQENIESLRKVLGTTIERNKFKDKDGVVDEGKIAIAYDAIKIIIDENMETNGIMLNTEQLKDKYNSIVEILTKEQITTDLNKAFGESPFSRYRGNMDKTVKRFVEGDMSGLRTLDPDMFERITLEMGKVAKEIAVKELPGQEFKEVRLHDGFLPVYRIGNEEYIVDVDADGRRQTLISFDDAKKKYANLNLGKPIGTVLNNMILTYDGYKKVEDMRIVPIGGGTGYALTKEDGSIDNTKPAYVLAQDGRGEYVFTPIYSKLYDVAGVKKELEDIRELPKSEAEEYQELFSSKGSEIYNRLFEDSRPYDPFSGGM